MMSYNSDALMAGTILNGRYEIKEMIGMGGMAFVYRANDKVHQKDIAVKELCPSACCKRSQDRKNVVSYSKNAVFQYQNYKQSFYEEAKILMKCSSCPNIISAFDLFEENSTVYLVTELLEGITLQHYLFRQKEPLAEPKIIYMTLEVLNALSFLHHIGYLHLDISDDNIFITSSGKVKLIDFGSAAAQAADNHVIASKSIILKIHYAPPEQYQSDGLIGAWTDLYALGAVMYEAVTKIKVTGAMERIHKDDMGSPKQINSQISDRLDFIIRKALALNAKDRFQSAEEFRDSIIIRNDLVHVGSMLYNNTISICMKIIGFVCLIICCILGLLWINR